MQLRIQHFGSISSAELDLSKDLIILTGENNTGKTYVANAVAGVFDFNTSTKAFIFEDIEKEIVEGQLELTDLLNEGYVSTLIDTLNINILEDVKNYLKYDININTHFEIKSTETEINEQHIKEIHIDESVFYLDGTNHKIRYSKPKGTTSLYVKFEENGTSCDVRDRNFLVSATIKRVFFSALFRTTFFVPAERQGIALLSKELALIKNKSFDRLLSNGKRQEMLSFFESRFNRYPKSVQDALDFMQNLDYHRTQKTEFTYLADELDELFFDGNIHINEQGDIQFRPNRSSKSLEIHETSSTVKSLSWLSLYLRHLAKAGEFIIIDEPELNLHPDNQVKVARFLTRLVNEGFKVMISTHSDYIIRELNTLIMLKTGMKKDQNGTVMIMHKYDYKEEELIGKEQVGVYLFKQGKPVESVAVEEDGFQIETIDRTVSQLNESSENIYFELF